MFEMWWPICDHEETRLRAKKIGTAAPKLFGLKTSASSTLLRTPKASVLRELHLSRRTALETGSKKLSKHTSTPTDLPLATRDRTSSHTEQPREDSICIPMRQSDFKKANGIFTLLREHSRPAEPLTGPQRPRGPRTVFRDCCSSNSRAGRWEEPRILTMLSC